MSFLLKIRKGLIEYLHELTNRPKSSARVLRENALALVKLSEISDELNEQAVAIGSDTLADLAEKYSQATEEVDDETLESVILLYFVCTKYKPK